jgi:hypothetical protein
VHRYEAVSQAIATQTVFCEADWFVRDDFTRRMFKRRIYKALERKGMITQRSRGTGGVVLCRRRAPGVEVIAPADLPRSMATAESGARYCGGHVTAEFHMRGPRQTSAEPRNHLPVHGAAADLLLPARQRSRSSDSRGVLVKVHQRSSWKPHCGVVRWQARMLNRPLVPIS